MRQGNEPKSKREKEEEPLTKSPHQNETERAKWRGYTLNVGNATRHLVQLLKGMEFINELSLSRVLSLFQHVK